MWPGSLASPSAWIGWLARRLSFCAQLPRRGSAAGPKVLSNVEEEEITEFCKNQITLPNKYDPSDELCWQHHLYSTLGSKQCVSADQMKPEELELLVNRIVAMGKVLYGLHVVSWIFKKLCKFLC